VHLLHGDLSDFQAYSGHEHCAWLLDMAHDICDPRHKRGSLFVFQSGAWNAVQPCDPLSPAAYTYCLPRSTIINLTQLSKRRGVSITSAAGAAVSMRNQVLRRDNSTCWVSFQQFPVTNSRIVPKRMGDNLAGCILSDFCGVSAAGCTVSETRFAVCLNGLHDPLFKNYQLGFRHVSGETYAVHLFTRRSTWTRHGESPVCLPLPDAWFAPLHGTHLEPPTLGHPENPPPGLLRWHYLQ
ncbi:hypothetical protein AURDEDRAFT_23030, partial [Auricularia subglabra TFB-10046 SS5]